MSQSRTKKPLRKHIVAPLECFRQDTAFPTVFIIDESKISNPQVVVHDSQYYQLREVIIENDMHTYPIEQTKKTVKEEYKKDDIKLDNIESLV